MEPLNRKHGWRTQKECRVKTRHGLSGKRVNQETNQPKSNDRHSGKNKGGGEKKKVKWINAWKRQWSTPQNRLRSLECQRGTGGGNGGGRRKKNRKKVRGGGSTESAVTSAQPGSHESKETQHGEITERNAALKHAANAAGSRDRTRGRNGGGVGRGNYKTSNCSYIERARNCANPEREAKTSVWLATGLQGSPLICLSPDTELALVSEPLLVTFLNNQTAFPPVWKSNN